MRALNTGAEGMKAQQLMIDTISNNLANVNTTAYKGQRMEFKDLLYETLEKAKLKKDGKEATPSNLQVGHGVKVSSMAKNFSKGSFTKTDNKFDLAIDGEGFFEVKGFNDKTAYTKDGTFKIIAKDDGYGLATSDGYPLLNSNDEPLTIPQDISLDSVSINPNGTFNYKDADGEIKELDQKIKLVRFLNTQGLLNKGDNLYEVSEASGEAIVEDADTENKSQIKQGYIERSNVKVVEEMTNLITAQRAYELNSKAIKSADEMMQQANNLRR